MGNKELGIADPVYDALRIRSGQSIAPDLGGGSTGGNGLENKIYVWHADGSTLDIFDPDSAGLALALAAAASGDRVWCPAAIPIACTAGIAVPAGVTLFDANLSFSGFSGVGVTMSAGSALQNLYLVYDGTGQAAATGVSAQSIACTMFFVNTYIRNATTNIGLDVAGLNSANIISLAEIYGSANGGTTAIGIRAGYFVQGSVCYGDADDIGIQFTATSAANALPWFSVKGVGREAGSVGMDVAAAKYGRIIAGTAVGVTAGLRINAGATALVYGLEWSSLVNNGTIVYLPGDRDSSGDATYLRLDASNDPLTGELAITPADVATSKLHSLHVTADNPHDLSLVPIEQVLIQNPSTAAISWKQANIGFKVYDGTAHKVIGWVGATAGSFTFAPRANATYIENFSTGGLLLLSDDPTYGVIEFFAGGYTDLTYRRLTINPDGTIRQYGQTFLNKPDSTAAGIGLDPNAATGNFQIYLSPSNLTGNRRATLQDKDGTIAYLSDIPVDTDIPGAGQVIGLARWAASSAQTTFDLPDTAEQLNRASDNGSIIDPATVTLSANHTQMVLDVGITAGHVVTAEYVIAQV